MSSTSLHLPGLLIVRDGRPVARVAGILSPPIPTNDGDTPTPDLDIALRPIAIADAAELARLYVAQREFLAPFEPIRPDASFTEAGQREAIEDALEIAEAGRGQRFTIVSGGAIVGVLTVSNLVRGAFQSANVGYFVAREWNGRGVATRAVGDAVRWAFGESRLHRLEAATLTDNVGSQRVLLHNGFREIGLARRYLRIAGEWRDHILFATTVEDHPTGASARPWSGRPEEGSGGRAP